MCTGEGNNIALYKHCVISGKFCCSVIQLCSTLCDPMHCSMPGFPDLQYLLEFAQTHVCWVDDAIQSDHLLSPFSSCPQFFPTSGSFPVSQLFTSGGQSIGTPASASVLPMNIQGWFPLGWTGCIFLVFRGLSRVFSSTMVWKHQFFSAQLSLWSNPYIHKWLLLQIHLNLTNYICSDPVSK